jgi:hypothetical protein
VYRYPFWKVISLSIFVIEIMFSYFFQREHLASCGTEPVRGQTAKKSGDKIARKKNEEKDKIN